MKSKIFSLAIAAIALGSASVQAQYVDLSTGQQITVIRHKGNGMMFNTTTQKPVHIYVNMATNDTIYGRTGAIINGRVMRTEDGKFMYHDGDYIFDNGEYRMRRESDSAGYKIKRDGDGDTKVKYGDYKRKTDKNGDLKVKDGEAKVKDYSDGRLKVKDGEYRKKIDGDGNYREGDDSLKIKLNADGTAKIKDKRNDYKGKVNEEGEIKIKDKDKKKKVKNGKVKVKKNDE